MWALPFRDRLWAGITEPACCAKHNPKLRFTHLRAGGFVPADRTHARIRHRAQEDLRRAHRARKGGPAARESSYALVSRAVYGSQVSAPASQPDTKLGPPRADRCLDSPPAGGLWSGHRRVPGAERAGRERWQRELGGAV